MANNRELSQFANVVGYNGGNIGIGTDNPPEKLSIENGNIFIRDTSDDDALIYFTNSPIANRRSHIGAVEGTGNSNSLVFATNADGADGEERLRIDSTGRVGINTDTFPDARDCLIVAPPSGQTDVFFTIKTLSTNGNTRLQFSDPDDTNVGDISYTHSNNAMVFKTADTERLRIDSSGRIGIGTDDPTSLIHGLVSSGSAILTLKSTATSGEASVSLSGKNSSGTVRTGIFKYDNTDMFRIGTTAGIPIRFETNDTERLRIDSSGRVLIGTTTEGNASADDLTVASSGETGITIRSGSSSNGNIYFSDTTSGTGEYAGIIAYEHPGNAMSFSTNSNERLRITSAGKIQVTGTRGGTLQPSDDDTLELYTKATSGNASTGGGITFYNHHGGGHVMGGVIHVVKQNGTYENSQSDMLFGTRINGSNVAYRARLTSHGSWETLSSTVNIDIANSQSSGNNEAFIYARYGGTSLGAGTLSFRVYTNGNVANTNNNYGSISDQNLKENIVDATSQWNDIKALQVRKYNFREATGHQTHTQLGLIAQEVESVSPGLVQTTPVREGETCEDADGNQLESIKSINYSILYMKAVKALQEAQTRIETLEAQHADLLARVTALEGS